MKKSTKHILISIIFVAAIGLIGTRCNKTDEQKSAGAGTGNQVDTGTNVENGDSIDTTSTAPKEVVQNYINATIGTIPTANLDYEYAKTLVTDGMRSKWTDDSFVPMSYGIQQGPDDVKMGAENISGSSAIVSVDAVYSGTANLSWEFKLEKVGGEWKIAGIETFYN